jgi:hypothetical protein
MWDDPWKREERERRQRERPARPDRFEVRPFTNNLGELRYIVVGRSGGCHCGDKVFKTHPDALAFAKMEAAWHGAELIDRAGKAGR